MGLSAAEESPRLTFGAIEPLVTIMEESSPDQLFDKVTAAVQSGTSLRQLISAAALANARAFGGQDYEGYHAMMALAPALAMSAEMPDAQRLLPVFKVLYRNTSHIQGVGARTHEKLHPVDSSAKIIGADAKTLLARSRSVDMDGAEGVFASLADRSIDDAYNALLEVVQDNTNVHRVVLAWRSWAMLDITGKEYAHTLLRQSLRYCVDEEAGIKRNKTEPELRRLLPTLLSSHSLAESPRVKRQADDAWISNLARLIYSSPRAAAASAVADALAEGFRPEDVGEAISLAANQLVLHDPGRQKADSDAKPIGSVHGASVGVHASDAANAWRNIARVSNYRNTIASLIVGAYHTAGQTNGQLPQEYPLVAHREKTKDVKDADLLAETDAAIRAKDQGRASALVHRYGELGRDSRPIFDLLLKYAISEDGALHAEKYYRTVSEEFAVARPAFRWRHLDALARVTASEYGYPAPGVAEARKRLSV